MRCFLALVSGTLMLIGSAHAATYTMTPADDWTKLENAVSGDVVEIAPGTYQFRVYLDHAGTAEQPIVIRAQDPANRPVWDLAGDTVGNWPGSYSASDKHRGGWQVGASGAHYVISGIVFRNCRASASAGLRLINSGPVRVHNCLFHDNTNGMTGSSEHMLIEFSEFTNNGKLDNSEGTSTTHNIYNYGGRATIRYSYFHGGRDGMHFHMRAHQNLIEYNWFESAYHFTGDLVSCEYQCGVPDVGTPVHQYMTLRGNVIVQGTAHNGSQILVQYDDVSDTGYTVADLDMTLINNTIIGTPRNPGQDHMLIHPRNDAGPTHAHLYNNIIYNVAEIYAPDVPGDSNWSLDGHHNWVSEGATGTDGLTDLLVGIDPGFVAVGSQDYRLEEVCDAVGAADPTVDGVPDLEYFLHQQYRARLAADDLGAFEFGTATNPVGPYEDAPVVDGGVEDAAVDAGVADVLVADLAVVDVVVAPDVLVAPDATAPDVVAPPDLVTAQDIETVADIVAALDVAAADVLVSDLAVTTPDVVIASDRVVTTPDVVSTPDLVTSPDLVVAPDLVVTPPDASSRDIAEPADEGRGADVVNTDTIVLGGGCGSCGQAAPGGTRVSVMWALIAALGVCWRRRRS